MDEIAYRQWLRSESGKRVRKLHNTEKGGGGGEFEEDYTTTAACGALPVGTTIEAGTSSVEVLKLMTTRIVAPQVTLKCKANFMSSYGTEIRYNQLTQTFESVSYQITGKKQAGGEDITSLEIHAATAGGTDIWSTDEPIDNHTYTIEDASLLSTAYVGVVRDNAKPNPQIATSIVNVYPCYPRYYGQVDASADTITTVAGLTQPSLTTSRGMSYSNITTGGQLKKIVFFYAASLGNATSIKDGQNEENILGYTKKEIYFDGTNISQEAQEGYTKYNLYILNTPMSVPTGQTASLTLS